MKARTMTVRSILVATDFSDGSMVALDAAMSLCESFKEKPTVTLLHVWSGTSRMPEMTIKADQKAGTSKRLLEEARAHGLAVEDAARFLAKLEERGFVLEARMVNGPVAETIASTAKERSFDLVVMGTNGRTGLRAAATGSVAEKVVRLSEVPVLVARMREEPRSRKS